MMPHPHTFTFTWPDGYRVVWDITRCTTLTWASLPHWIRRIPRTVLRSIVTRQRPDTSALDWVDPTYPGLVAAILDDLGGHSWLLIDGYKRAAKVLREYLPSFAVLVVPTLVSRQSILHCDDWDRLPVPEPT